MAGSAVALAASCRNLRRASSAAFTLNGCTRSTAALTGRRQRCKSQVESRPTVSKILLLTSPSPHHWQLCIKLGEAAAPGGRILFFQPVFDFVLELGHAGFRLRCA